MNISFSRRDTKKLGGQRAKKHLFMFLTKNDYGNIYKLTDRKCRHCPKIITLTHKNIVMDHGTADEAILFGSMSG